MNESGAVARPFSHGDTVAEGERWTAAQAAAASRDFAELRVGPHGVFWSEFDPHTGRCSLWQHRANDTRCLIDGRSLRSRVYEYGGGAFCLSEAGVVFVDERDQQLHYLGCAVRPTSARLTRVDDTLQRRYGDLHYAAAWQAVLAVEESHEADGVHHRLVRLDLDGRRTLLVEGADFYAAPVLSPDGERLAWIEWNRPQQPWTATRLCQRLTASGETQCLAGQGGDESLQQPRFDAAGNLYCLSDRGGWWQPYVMAAASAGLASGAALTEPAAAAMVSGDAPCASLVNGAHSAPYGDAASWQRGEAGSELTASVGCAARTDPDAAPLVAGVAPCLSPVNGAHGAPYDHAPAPWQLGGCTYLLLDHGGLLLTRFEQGFGVLLELRDGRERRLAPDFTRFRSLAADAERFYCIAGAPDRLPAVLAIERRSGAVKVLAGGERPLPANRIPRPEALSVAVGAEELAHGFIYAPSSATQLPPLVVFLHGGPTSVSYPVFDPRIPFWTERGFAVLDLNYRGSAGYGRAYRQRLAGGWGVLEVEDIRAAVAQLAAQERIDPARVFVRGASAGGYSALCALLGGGFRGGASLYGVSDPLALRRATHKFEADYLDWLIGDPQRDAARYQARTPLFHAGRLGVPVIFFQGGRDAVVVPAQTESMVAALRARGLPVEYHCYPDEAHGFRQAAHIADALEREWRFYQALL